MNTEQSKQGGAAGLGDAELSRALALLQRAMFKYPMAVQAAFSALVAEGKRFATTTEGREWFERLNGARDFEQAELLWEVLSTGAFTEKHSGPLPTFFVDALADALRKRHLEPLLMRVFARKA